MPRINEVVLERKFNIGNYESITVRASVSPLPDEECTISSLLSDINGEILTASPKLIERKRDKPEAHAN